MKKKSLLCLLFIASLTSCGTFGNRNVDFGIGDGTKENDSVRINLQYLSKWTNDKVVIKVRYGHESQAVLANRYDLSISKTNPLFSPDNYTLQTIYSFTKDDLLPKTVTIKGYDSHYSNNTLDSIQFTDLSSYFEITEKDEVKQAYFVFSSTNTNFRDITTFGTHDINYTFDGKTLKLK